MAIEQTNCPIRRGRGRNEARNSALVQTLWSSGLRIREAATLVVHEVPDFPDEGDWSDGWVANATAKGSGREYLIEYEALRAIEKYQRTSRAEAVRRAQEAGRYDRVRDMLVVPAAALRRQMDSLGPEDRLRLFVAGDEGLEPAMLWLTESGMPMPHHTWQQVFRRANERCAFKGRATPLHGAHAPVLVRAAQAAGVRGSTRR